MPYLLLILFIATCLGRKILGKVTLSFESTLEEFCFSVGLGLGFLALLTFGLGLLGKLYPWLFYLLFIVFLIILYPEILYILRTATRKFKMLKNFKLDTFYSLLAAFLILHLTVNFIGSLTPVTSWDAATYHLALPKVFLMNHKIFNLPIDFSGFPAIINMLYLLGLLINGEVLASLINFLFSILVILLIYTFCSRFFSTKVALLAATIFYATPVVNETSSSLMVDQGTTFFLLLSLYAFYEWFVSENKNFLILSAITYGFALGCKHTILSFAPLFLFVIILKNYRQKINLTQSLGSIFIFSVISFIVFAPWLAKNLFFTGNPFYPFFDDLFPSRYLNQSSINIYFSHIVPMELKRSFTNLLSLPLNLTMKGAWEEAIGPLYLIFIPLLFIIKGFPKTIKHILTFSILYLIISFYCLLWVQKRFLLQIFPLFSIISAYVIYWLMDKDKILKYFIASLLLFCASFNLILLIGQNYFKFPVVFGIENREEYLSRRVPTYEVIKYLNLSTDVKKVLFLDPRTYYSDKPYLWGEPISQGLIDYSEFKNIEEMLEKFNDLGISHLLVYEPWLEKNKKTWAASIFAPLNKLYEKLKTNESFELVYSKNGTYLYEILYPKIKR